MHVKLFSRTYPQNFVFEKKKTFLLDKYFRFRLPVFFCVKRPSETFLSLSHVALAECKRKASVPSRMLDSLFLLQLAFRVALAFCLEEGRESPGSFFCCFPSFLWEIIVFPYALFGGVFFVGFFCRSDMEEESIWLCRGEAKKASYFHAIKCRRFFAAKCGVCVWDQKAALLRDDTAKNRMREVPC